MGYEICPWHPALPLTLGRLPKLAVKINLLKNLKGWRRFPANFGTPLLYAV